MFCKRDSRPIVVHMKMHIYTDIKNVGRDNPVYIVIGRVNPKMKNIIKFSNSHV